MGLMRRARAGLPASAGSNALRVALCFAALFSLIASAHADKPLRVVYFFSPTCLKCQKAKLAVDAAEKKWGSKIRLERHDVLTDDGLLLMLDYEDRYGSKAGAAPKVFFAPSKKFIEGVDAITEKLDATIASEYARLNPKKPDTIPTQRPPATQETPATQEVPATQRVAPPMVPATQQTASAPATQVTTTSPLRALRRQAGIYFYEIAGTPPTPGAPVGCEYVDIPRSLGEHRFEEMPDYVMEQSRAYVLAPGLHFGRSDVSSVEPSMDPYGGVAARVWLTEDAGRRLEKWTRARRDQPVVVLIDGKVVNAARVRSTLASMFATAGTSADDVRKLLGLPKETMLSTITLSEERKKELLEKRTSQLTLWAVIVAGLVDGVNPCAFATIVFLLSMLAYLGKSRRDILVVGIVFATMVFITYFLLGWGLMMVIKTFAVTSGISKGLTYGIAALTFVLGLWSFYDAVRIRRSGKVPKNALGMPKWAKTRAHSLIRKHLKTRNLVIGAAILGFLISLLESFCTGQVYLPITKMLAEPEMRSLAIGYLLIYNVMFILPLLAIIALCYLGVSSDKLGGFLQRRVGLLKVLMGIVFTGLGVMLVVMG